MANSGFGAGFAPDFGWNGKGELLLVTGSHPTYEDGDILVAVNRMRIRGVHAEMICWPRIAGRKVGGRLGNTMPLLQSLHENVYEYRFQRVSATEVRRTVIATDEEDMLSGTPNEHGEAIDVAQFIERRVAASKKPLFGTEGAEVWYGGNTIVTHAKLDVVWSAIESQTAHRETSFINWPWSEREKRGFLAIDVDDFDDATAGELTSSIIEEDVPGELVIVKKRKHMIAWRDLRDVVPDHVLDQDISVDIRGRKHVRSSVVNVKNV